MNLTLWADAVTYFEKWKQQALNVHARRGSRPSQRLVRLNPSDLLSWEVKRGQFAGTVRVIGYFKGDMYSTLCGGRIASDVIANSKIPYKSEGVPMEDKKSEEKTFTPGKLVTREAYEAAAAVMAQAAANGQLQNDYSDHGTTSGNVFYKDAMRIFKSPERLREEAKKSLERDMERLQRYQAAVDRANDVLRQLGDDKSSNAADALTYVGTVRGGRIQSDVNMQTLPKAQVPGSVLETRIPDRGGHFIEVTDRATDGSCNCKYEGYKFHVSDCTKKGTPV